MVVVIVGTLYAYAPNSVKYYFVKTFACKIRRLSVKSRLPMMRSMITTAELAERAGVIQRTVQKRIKRLKIVPQRVGVAFLLTLQQAEKVMQDEGKAGRPRKKTTNGNGQK